MDISTYLSRIGYSGPTDPTVETLFALQRAHLYTVPFENLDIHLGHPIRLEEDALYEKIVIRRRGGFCYELNGLFSRLLRLLGYGVVLLNARGVRDDGAYSREFDHMALQVTCPDEPERPWLVDVGWGNGPLAPLRLDEPGVQSQGERLFKIHREDEYFLLTEHIPEEALEKGLAEDGPDVKEARWIKHYAFTLIPRAYEDFYECCQYHSTSPDSFFAHGRLCSLFLPNGRITLSELHLITTRDGIREERSLAGEDEFRVILKDWFAIDLPA
jgi:N-hydroxyarylamine O-acetyltransferase